ncbi:transcriptional regulator [Nonomuraea sp. H19]
MEAAGYVKVSKTFVGKRPLTAPGRLAFERHLRALREIAEVTVTEPRNL